MNSKQSAKELGKIHALLKGLTLVDVDISTLPTPPLILRAQQEQEELEQQLQQQQQQQYLREQQELQLMQQREQQQQDQLPVLKTEVDQDDSFWQLDLPLPSLISVTTTTAAATTPLPSASCKLTQPELTRQQQETEETLRLLRAREEVLEQLQQIDMKLHPSSTTPTIIATTADDYKPYDVTTTPQTGERKAIPIRNNSTSNHSSDSDGSMHSPLNARSPPVEDSALSPFRPRPLLQHHHPQSHPLQHQQQQCLEHKEKVRSKKRVRFAVDDSDSNHDNSNSDSNNNNSNMPPLEDDNGKNLRPPI